MEGFIDDGAPVAWSPPVEPIFRRAGGVALVKGAGHPAAAQLFADWILGDGQKLMVELGRDSARRDLAAAKGVEGIEIDVVALAAEQREWSDRHDRLLRLGTTRD